MVPGHVNSITDMLGPCGLALHQGQPEGGVLPRELLTSEIRSQSSTFLSSDPPAGDSP